MINNSAMFKYKTIKGPLHKPPALLKLILFLPLCIFCMTLPSLWLAAGIAGAILIAFICRINIQEQLSDLKPAFLYAVLMYLLSVFSNLFDSHVFDPVPNPDYLRVALRLVLVIQISALLFRTTSSMEIRESLCLFLPRQLAQNISLFLGFIPQLFETWSLINLAWKARRGKNGAGKIMSLVFILISLSMEKAAVKARALEARDCTERVTPCECLF
jgi:energy-coupling factor transporter transmembrane protein EcfT